MSGTTYLEVKGQFLDGQDIFCINFKKLLHLVVAINESCLRGPFRFYVYIFGVQNKCHLDRVRNEVPLKAKGTDLDI